ncbi:UBA/TS-N domain containing protein [Trichomonas vaginalis G3]|uniref:UBA/TS-N domain containing protein n=1 Tax=Trichomonas vaginalis (strain ATCC PRA-98 / G3) TaxID=412133 RepID=A2DH02_TRIV3|nr:UBA-like family [Trichomonas vaginalis G3]EAY20312.1 UBA/TS-N domain containing protein [Trichomonas vaginalis G3]KAI5530699.1 UBA-like family [Trichomonas vaginalis G3]|eukprot:XP_001581298.1 UBA/TS-N domain containing protein [Trichomonas vaginalis G3]
MNNTFGSIGFQDYDIFDIITTRDQEVQVKLEHSPRISSDDDIEIDGFSSSEDEMEAEKLPEHIDDLLAMGFDKDTSAAALSVTHGDVNAAVSLILSGNVSHFEKPKQPVKVIKETEITPEFLAHGWKDHFRDCMDSSDALNEFVAEIARYDPELHYYLAQNQDILDEFIYDE